MADVEFIVANQLIQKQQKPHNLNPEDSSSQFCEVQQFEGSETKVSGDIIIERQQLQV